MHVALKNVTVIFGENTTVLKNINLDIPPQKKVAIVGPSGSGKSTIAGLLRRQMDPTRGEVLINSIPLPEYNLSSVLAHVGVILQRPEIISGDVRENILLAVPAEHLSNITDSDIWDMIRLVSPDMRARFGKSGLDTLVGKQGLQLSGGEQQRLCIMRALVKKPEFLIVDEATSSLDSETETAVQEGIDTALAQGISALLIAHRFSTLRACDHFIVLKKLIDCVGDESQIEARADSLQELYEISPTFRRLADKQGFQI